MNPAERRTAIFAVIAARRYDSFLHLAAEFGVSERTIQRDIMLLTLTYPVETVRGRRGGVRVLDWFRPEDHCLNPKQILLLHKIEPFLKGEDRVILSSILLQFSPR